MDESHGTWASLNIPAFKHLLGRVDSVAEHRNNRYRVVHDETNQFGRALAMTQKMATGTPRQGFSTVGPRGVFARPILTRATTFTTAVSNADLGVQAADVLATTVSRAITKAVSGDYPDSQAWFQLIMPLLVLLMHDDATGYPPFAGLYVSPTTQESLMKMMVKGMQHPPSS